MDKDFFDVPEGLWRSEEHTSELQSQSNLVCRLLLEKKKSRYIVRDRCSSFTLSHIDSYSSAMSFTTVPFPAAERAVPGLVYNNSTAVSSDMQTPIC